MTGRENLTNILIHIFILILFICVAHFVYRDILHYVSNHN